MLLTYILIGLLFQAYIQDAREKKNGETSFFRRSRIMFVGALVIAIGTYFNEESDKDHLNLRIERLEKEVHELGRDLIILEQKSEGVVEDSGVDK